jgi:hypothetical protein
MEARFMNGPYWDPAERLDDEARNDWEVAQHLYAQRRLRDLEERGHRRSQLFSEPQNGPRCCRAGCGRTDTRLIRLTGDVVCPAHDPLVRCHDRQGWWGCSASFPRHPWPHRYMTLLEEGN